MLVKSAVLVKRLGACDATECLSKCRASQECSAFNECSASKECSPSDATECFKKSAVLLRVQCL